MILPYYKCCPKLVPEDSVRPETQTLVVLIRRKGFVGCFQSHIFQIALITKICLKARYFKYLHSKVKIGWIKARIKTRISQIILRVGMISVDTKWNTKSENYLSRNDWRWETKVRKGNRIRYPDTSHCQRWMVVC